MDPQVRVALREKKVDLSWPIVIPYGSFVMWSVSIRPATSPRSQYCPPVLDVSRADDDGRQHARTGGSFCRLEHHRLGCRDERRES